MLTGYEHLTDKELLAEVYSANTRPTLMYELAKRLDRTLYGPKDIPADAAQMELFDGNT
jgi:hypothetical protein